MTNFNETTAGQTFIASGDSRQTDARIMQAIAFFARDTAEAEALWNGDGFGTVCTVSDLWEHVTNNGLHDATDFCWGAAGSDWYAALTS
jgi:hypothetical protein